MHGGKKKNYTGKSVISFFFFSRILLSFALSNTFQCSNRDREIKRERLKKGEKRSTGHRRRRIQGRKKKVSDFLYNHLSLYTVKFVVSSSSLHSKSSLLYCKIFFYYEIFLFVSCVMNIDYFTKSRDLFLSLFVGLRVKQRSLFLYSLLNLPISLIIKNMMMLMRGMVTFEGNGVCCCCCSLFHFYWQNLCFFFV
jgi:hypothetical protein